MSDYLCANCGMDQERPMLWLQTWLQWLQPFLPPARPAVQTNSQSILVVFTHSGYLVQPTINMSLNPRIDKRFADIRGEDARWLRRWWWCQGGCLGCPSAHRSLMGLHPFWIAQQRAMFGQVSITKNGNFLNDPWHRPAQKDPPPPCQGMTTSEAPLPCPPCPHKSGVLMNLQIRERLRWHSAHGVLQRGSVHRRASPKTNPLPPASPC